MTEDLKIPNNLYEFRKFLFKNLVKEGLKYIARVSNGSLYAYSHQPIKGKWGWRFDVDIGNTKSERISIVSPVFPDIKWEDEEPFEIPYTNWKEVPVDTPVIYTNGDGMNYIRHFCKYDEENDRVVLYAEGRTSFTAKGIIETSPEKVSIYGEEEEINGEEKELPVLMV